VVWPRGGGSDTPVPDTFGTLSIGSLALSLLDNRVQIQLVTLANSAVSVTVNNMQQFKF
jgi:hypothetical protein